MTLLQASGLRIQSAGGRTLIDGLNMQLERDAVALVGRNGVGKSTLLRVLSGADAPARGRVRGERALLVPQQLAGGLSPGERRRYHLDLAFRQEPALLLLDEPSRDLDEAGVRWLRQRLSAFDGGLVVASHREAILELFEHFFVVEEEGCRYFAGTFLQLKYDLDARRRRAERRFVAQLKDLEASEVRHERILRRRRRKKNLGRLHELGRNPSRGQLGAKTSYAQESQGRAAKIRNHRQGKLRARAALFRQALQVNLPLSRLLKAPGPNPSPAIRLQQISLRRGEAHLRDVSFQIAQHRVAITGPNGAG
ncbi:MAG: ATP-binding cassette domain-containing protein, partial [Myxococcota bacterium]